jgi:hypothetical protein
MVTGTKNAPWRVRKSFAQICQQFWREIEPGIDIDRNNSIERWDCKGEGRATGISFEGFGLSVFIVIGRTPKVRS